MSNDEYYYIQQPVIDFFHRRGNSILLYVITVILIMFIIFPSAFIRTIDNKNIKYNFDIVPEKNVGIKLGSEDKIFDNIYSNEITLKIVDPVPLGVSSIEEINSSIAGTAPGITYITKDGTKAVNQSISDAGEIVTSSVDVDEGDTAEEIASKVSSSSVSANANFNNILCTGTLSATGVVTEFLTENTKIKDQLIELGTGNTDAPSGDSGIIIQRGSSTNAFMGWDESADTFKLATTTATGISTGDLDLTDAALTCGVLTAATGSAIGTLTLGNGSITDSSGNISFGDNYLHAKNIKSNNFSNNMWGQIGNDIDGEAANDESGHSVSLSSDGSIVAIGAQLNDGNGNRSGHVRVYKWSGSAWAQRGGDIDGEASMDSSGWSVSLSSDGSIVAIGAYKNDGGGIQSGHTRVYKWSGSAWAQRGGDIDGEAVYNQSGYSVSLSSDGSVVAIGAPHNDEAAGHVRVYHWNGIAWVQRGSDIDGDTKQDASGNSVSLSSDGNIVTIGAYLNVGNGSNAGHVRVYKWSGSSWVQLGSDIDGEAASDQSGWSVSSSSDGSIVAIGAKYNDGKANNAGHTRIFQYRTVSETEWNSNTIVIATASQTGVNSNGSGDRGTDSYSSSTKYWIQRGSDIDGEASNDQSGHSVSLSSDGSIVAIAARMNDGNGNLSGHTRVYHWNGSVWDQLGSDIDGETGDQSGNSVSLSSGGTIVAIGAGSNDDAATNAGHVRVYQLGDFVSNMNIGNLTLANGSITDSSGAISFGDENLSTTGTLGCGALTAATGSVIGNLTLGNASITDSSGTISFGDNILYAKDIKTSNLSNNDIKTSNLRNNIWGQVGEDIDGEATGDRSGWSISMSSDGSIVAIGAYSNDGGGTSAGHVRVYRWNGSAWVKRGDDIDGEESGDQSGQRLSLSSDGSIVAIGAYSNDDNGFKSGHVRVYKWSGSAWVKRGSDINGEVSGDESGYSVSLSSDGSIVAIGARFNDGGGQNAGHVRIHQWNGSSWVQLGSDIDGEAAGDFSGISVSLSSDGSIVAIGAPFNDGTAGEDSGHVRVFQYRTVSETEWNSNTIVIATASQTGVNSNGSGDRGSDSYSSSTNYWIQMGSDIDGEAAGDFSGISVSLSSDGNIVAIGANKNSADRGHVRVHQWNGSSWDQVGDDIDGEAAGDFSGYSVSLSSDGNSVAIGAHANDGTTGNLIDNRGHVRVYQLGEFLSNLTVGGISFYGTVTISGTRSITNALNAGRTNLLGEVGGNALVTLTLPDATGSGNVYKFIVSVVNTTNYKFVCPDADNTISGQIIITDGDGTAASFFHTAATTDTITLNGTTTGGGAIGDYIELTDILAKKWAVSGMVTCPSGSDITTMFSATVP